jgi:hypothetical protein
MHHECIMSASLALLSLKHGAFVQPVFNHQVAPSASLTTYDDDREERRDDDEREMTK